MENKFISIPSILFEEMTGFISDVLPGCGPNRKKDAECILTAINDVRKAQNQVDATGLKKCPFCGGNACRTVSDEDGRVLFAIICMDCEVSTGLYDSDEDAVRDWNRRVF